MSRTGIQMPAQPHLGGGRAWWIWAIVVEFALYLFNVLTMYVILFVSFIRLHYTKKEVDHPFKAGRGCSMAWVVTLVGLVSAVVSFVLCFFPPAQLDIHHKQNYILILAMIYGSYFAAGGV